MRTIGFLLFLALYWLLLWFGPSKDRSQNSIRIDHLKELDNGKVNIIGCSSGREKIEGKDVKFHSFYFRGNAAGQQGKIGQDQVLSVEEVDELYNFQNGQVVERAIQMSDSVKAGILDGYITIGSKMSRGNENMDSDLVFYETTNGHLEKTKVYFPRRSVDVFESHLARFNNRVFRRVDNTKSRSGSDRYDYEKGQIVE